MVPSTDGKLVKKVANDGGKVFTILLIEVGPRLAMLSGNVLEGTGSTGARVPARFKL